MNKKISEIEILSGDFSSSLRLPLADGGVHAGFPSPAQDYIDNSFDFNKNIISNPAATFYAVVNGDSMTGAGISDNDILVIDRSLDAIHNDIIVAFINGEFTVKYLDLSEKNNGVIWLRPANDKYEPIKITEDCNFKVWGVVSTVIKRLRK